MPMSMKAMLNILKVFDCCYSSIMIVVMQGSEKMGFLDFLLRLTGFSISLFVYSYLELIGGEDYDLTRYTKNKF